MSEIISFAEGLQNLKAAAQIQDDRAVEQAFAEQVYTRISSRCGPLMKDPNRIGFEVVWSNDDNTLLLGIWAFRLSQTDRSKLAYVVCFFHNGKVSVESIYDVSRKQFRPLTPEWCQHLLDSSSTSDGKGVERSHTMKQRPQVHLERILNSGYKMSSALAEYTNEQELDATLREMLQDRETERLLPSLAQRIGGTKMSSIILAACEQSAPFAQRIAGVVDEWTDVFGAPDATKQASQDLPLLELVVGPRAGQQFLKEASSEQRSKVAAAINTKGYWFEGYKTEDKPDYTTITYDASSDKNAYVEILGTGQHKVIQQDGSDIDAVIGLPLSLWTLVNTGTSLVELKASLNEGGDCLPCGYSSSSLPRSASRQRGVVSVKKKTWWSGEGPLWCLQNMSDDKPELTPANKMQSGKYYALYQEDLGCLVRPSRVKSIETKKGCTHVEFENNQTLLINPDSAVTAGFGVIDGSWKAIEVEVESRDERDCYPTEGDFKPLFPGNAASMRRVLSEDSSLKRATVLHDADLFTLVVEGRECLPVDRLNTMIKLAGVLCLAPDNAEEVLDHAIEHGRMDLWLEPASTKLAGAMMRVIDSPQWETTVDPVLQIRREEPQSFVLRTERQHIHTPASRIGDRYMLTNNGRNTANGGDEEGQVGDSKEDIDEIPDDVLLRGSPDQVAQYADGRQGGKVLDHGIIGSMAQAGDIGLYLDEYIPKLEDGLDHLGRCLFLFRLKPLEWRKLYGADDMLDLEDRLSSTYRMMGETVLQLIRKAALNQTSDRSA